MRQAAKFHKEAAELYEAELNPEKAVIHYQQAGDYYKGEDQTSSANQCFLKVGVLSAELEEYEKAVDIFEAVAASSLDVALLKWSVKDYFFQAGLCRLAIGDMLAAKRAIDRYRDQDVAFADTRECKLLEALCEAYDDQDVEKFTDAVLPALSPVFSLWPRAMCWMLMRPWAAAGVRVRSDLQAGQVEDVGSAAGRARGPTPSAALSTPR